MSEKPLPPHPDDIPVALAKGKKHWHKPLLWGAIVSFVVLLLYLGSSGRHQKAPPTPVDENNAPASEQVVKTNLKANLAKLAQDLHTTKAHIHALRAEHETTRFTEPVDRSSSGLLNRQRAQSKKELAVRRNMPTSMYSYAPPQATGTTKQSNTPQEAVLVGKGGNASFANQTRHANTVTVSNIPHPDTTLVEGELLHGVLETPISSQLPGMVRAVVTEPLYAYTGNRPLVPAGARLIGQYASKVQRGQQRVFIMWHRMVLPNGMTVQLNSPGADALGRAGTGADSIDRHFWARFGNASLLSVIGAGAANVGVNSQDQYNSASAYRQAIAQSFQQSAGDALQSDSDIQTTLSIHQGKRITVFVARDISFYEALHQDRSDG